MRKLQQFYVMKFPLDRLAKFDYSIERTIDQARKNEEMIALGDSQVLRLIRKIRHERNPKATQYSDVKLNELLKEKKLLQKQKSTKENISKIAEINKYIDEMLFVPEYISIVVENDEQYKYINQNDDNVAIKINGGSYVRLLCSAGQARVNTVIFIRQDYEDELKAKLKCGAKDVLITDNKWNAYFALSSSSTHTVSTPNVFFIDDCEIQMTKEVDWVSTIPNECREYLGNNEKIETIDKELPFNLFDGAGAISVEKAKEWAKELELDYLPSAFCIRCAFIKGMVFVVDFKKYAKEMVGKNIFIDRYGNQQDINNIDIILTESQFKLHNGYDSIEQYNKECIKNEFNWGISNVTPKEDKSVFRSNYQFNQVLNLNDEDIIKLCQPTIDWLEGVSKDNINYALLYLFGDLCNRDDIDYENILNLTNDNIAKAVLLNNKLLQDEYVRNTILYSINKKIRESYIGKLILSGNFSVMIPDMLAFMEHAFNQPVVGALKEFEHYSNYWNKRNAKTVAAMRSPLTWRSEVNKLSLIQNDKTKWFKYLTSGIVYNVHGCDCMLHADSDFDGDLVCTTDDKIFIEKMYGGVPITYEKKTVDKKHIKESELYKADLMSFNSTIGNITNKSTSMYDVVAKYENELDECGDIVYKKEYDEIIERLKLTRKAQGDAIDKAKGIKIEKMPTHWTNRQQIINEERAEKIYNQRKSQAKNPDRIKPVSPDIDDVINKKEFMNSIAADKKPYFFKYVYPSSYSTYKKYIDEKNKYCTTVFGMTIQELIDVDDSGLTDEQRQLRDDYYKYMPLSDNGGVMNRICYYMESQLKELYIDRNYRTPNYIINTLMTNKTCKQDEDKITQLEKLYHDYTKARRKFKARAKDNLIDPIRINTDDEEEFYNINQYCKYIRSQALKITSDIHELANLGVELCYIRHQQWSKDFVWNVFGDYLIENIKINKQKIIKLPVSNDDGDIEYLGKKYIEKEIKI